MGIFLEPDDIAELTGRKSKSGQIAQLRTMGLLFFVNAGGYPVVPKSSIDKTGQDINVTTWTPAVYGQKAKSK